MNERSFINCGKLSMADRESRKKQITEQRQEQILKAAGDIFSRKGYAAATVPEIARLAGVAVGTVYNYYHSKREIFIAVIKNFIITVPLLDLIGKIPEADIAVTFRQILQNFVMIIFFSCPRFSKVCATVPTSLKPCVTRLTCHFMVLKIFRPVMAYNYSWIIFAD